MRKIFTAILLAAFAVFAFGQESHHKDSRAFDIKLDFAGYNGTVKRNVKNDTAVTASAASIIISPQMSWALGNVVSIGASVSYSRYLDSASSKAVNPQLNGLDGNFLFDIHFLRKPKTDMMLGTKLGIAGIRYNPDDGTGDIYGSLGRTIDIHLMARFYVSNKLAIIANIAFPSYSYGNFGKNLAETSTVKFNGFCFGTGITFKLPNQKTSGTQRNK